MADTVESSLGQRDETERSDRNSDLVAALTTAEKLRLVHGAYPSDNELATGGVGYLPPIDRLEIPALRLEDGPLGIQSADGTAFPASIALGAAFDTDLADAFGRALGAEARAHDVDVLLAPGCNLVRVPHCGRNFEYYGEDPVHSAHITVPVVRGIQSRGVVATPKHYVANNQERERVRTSAEVDERTLRECYLRPFEAAVREGDAGAVMAAYNRINGTYATEHERLLTDVLKEEFGFDGPVMSDWWAVQDGPAAARAGLDLEMPGTGVLDQQSLSDGRLRYLRAIDAVWPDRLPGPEAIAARLFTSARAAGGMPSPESSSFARTLPAGLARGTLSERRLDDMVRRVLTLHERTGALDGQRSTADVHSGGDGDGCQPSHRDLARRIATSGAVLLKNDADTLPLEPSATVALIGPHVDAAKTGGGGSSEVSTADAVSPLEGVHDRSTGRLLAARGHPSIEESVLSDLTPDFASVPTWASTLRPGADRESALERARTAAADADVAVVVVQDATTEGEDRESLSLPGQQDALLSAVADSADRTVVVLQTAGPVEMPWLERVDAVLETWYPGQEAGDAIASLLYGETDPGGRLPVTFAASERDYPTHAPERYPGVDGDGSDSYPRAAYNEETRLGYRHFDERDIEPLFPFGHGLSYTTFEYGPVEPTVDGADASVSVPVTNTGDRRGKEVVQVYVRRSTSAATRSWSRVPRAPRELVGFESVTLAAGETERVQVTLDERSFAGYDDREGEWVVEPGEYVLEIGRSSRDGRATATITVQK